jgi:5'-3' exonuclease
VPGVGPGTAKKLLAKYHDAEDLLQHLDAVQPDALRASLSEAAVRIRQNERLARLETAVPLPDGPRAALPSAEAIERVRALFATLEFKSLLGRLPNAT